MVPALVERRTLKLRDTRNGHASEHRNARRPDDNRDIKIKSFADPYLVRFCSTLAILLRAPLRFDMKLGFVWSEVVNCVNIHSICICQVIQHRN